MAKMKTEASIQLDGLMGHDDNQYIKECNMVFGV